MPLVIGGEASPSVADSADVCAASLLPVDTERQTRPAHTAPLGQWSDDDDEDAGFDPDDDETYEEDDDFFEDDDDDDEAEYDDESD